jgi:hypothetical protein
MTVGVNPRPAWPPGDRMIDADTQCQRTRVEGVWVLVYEIAAKRPKERVSYANRLQRSQRPCGVMG